MYYALDFHRRITASHHSDWAPSLSVGHLAPITWPTGRNSSAQQCPLVTGSLVTKTRSLLCCAIRPRCTLHCVSLSTRQANLRWLLFKSEPHYPSFNLAFFETHCRLVATTPSSLTCPCFRPSFRPHCTYFICLPLAFSLHLSPNHVSLRRRPPQPLQGQRPI